MTQSRFLITLARSVPRCAARAFVGSLLGSAALHAQDRLETMPGYDQFTRMQARLAATPAVKSGAINPTWSANGKSLEYNFDGKRNRTAP